MLRDDGGVGVMQSLQSDRGLLDPSAQLVVAARWEDLDPLEFERFRRSVRERRGRSDESLQQEQMVLQYVEKHGRITRREVAGLCRIASHQARDLLGRLVARGELRMQGATKGAFYEPPLKYLEPSKSAASDSKRTSIAPMGDGPAPGTGAVEP